MGTEERRSVFERKAMEEKEDSRGRGRGEAGHLSVYADQFSCIIHLLVE